jgi:hypothetical protein
MPDCLYNKAFCILRKENETKKVQKVLIILAWESILIFYEFCPFAIFCNEVPIRFIPPLDHQRLFISSTLQPALTGSGDAFSNIIFIAGTVAPFEDFSVL